MSQITEACGLGDAIHAAFRKATACGEAEQVWKLIEDMPDEDWINVLEFIYNAMPERVRTAMKVEALEYAQKESL